MHLLMADVRFKSAQMQCQAMSPHSHGFEFLVSNNFSTGYCFNQEQRKPDAGLLDHLLRTHRFINKDFIHSMLWHTSTTLIF